jgi:hypothetical protein
MVFTDFILSMVQVNFQYQLKVIHQELERLIISSLEVVEAALALLSTEKVEEAEREL